MYKKMMILVFVSMISSLRAMEDAPSRQDLYRFLIPNGSLNQNVVLTKRLDPVGLSSIENDLKDKGLMGYNDNCYRIIYNKRPLNLYILVDKNPIIGSPYTKRSNMKIVNGNTAELI